MGLLINYVLKGKLDRDRRLNRGVKRVSQKNCRGKIGFREGTGTGKIGSC